MVVPQITRADAPSRGRALAEVVGNLGEALYNRPISTKYIYGGTPLAPSHVHSQQDRASQSIQPRCTCAPVIREATEVLQAASTYLKAIFSTPDQKFYNGRQESVSKTSPRLAEQSVCDNSSI